MKIITMIMRVIMFLGVLVAALAIPLSVGIAIYNWGVLDVALSAALWTGFKSWLSCVFGGLLVFCISFVVAALTH